MAIWDGIGAAGAAAAKAVAANKAMIHTAVNSGGTAQAASFSVDIEQIPGLIAKYEEAQDKLDRILRKAQDLRYINGPGEDEVSQQLASALGEMAGDGEGCLSWAVNDARTRIQGMIDQLKAAQGTYTSTDEAATASQV
ncbi:hypothetical protein LZ318_18105 [Saccharopolyspora indica]|uniref:hypothetical protein n=1 Tax=Saccharopolyspora indica TaxID=1229659 RepID=UPI0022EB8544|nr:hypothetical protein [Saccharopolyspora indica]MDA3648239.1 hypothetical protein [Saccharopolyspora indica]